MSSSAEEDFDFGSHALHLLRWMGCRITGRDYAVTTEIFGQPAKFVITSRRELKRVADVSYEGGFLRRIIGSLQDGDVFFDVGANIGLVSVLIGRRPEMANGRIYAFEPEPRNLAQLKRNLQANDFGERGVADGVALASKEGRAELHVRGPVGDGRHSLVVAKKSTDSVDVELITMTKFCADRGVKPDVVKIDVEGAEGEVIAGMGGLLAEGHPRELFMEIHSKGGEDRMPDDSLIDDFLARHGYSCGWREDRGSGQHRHYRKG